jgi:hypothetical protein
MWLRFWWVAQVGVLQHWNQDWLVKYFITQSQQYKKLNSLAWVRERTIPTERPPLVSEVTANFCGLRVPRDQRDGYLRPYSRISRPKSLLFLPSSSSIVLKRQSGPPSRLITSEKIWKRWESNHDPWICSQELWPLDHRGGPEPTLFS